MRYFLSLMIVPFVCVSCASAKSEYSWADALQAEIKDEWSASEYREFDFWIGEWESNWRGKPPGEFYHQAEGSWFHGRVFPILGGKALVELEWPKDNPEAAGQVGFSIRYYDPSRKRWVMAQNWPNQTNQGMAFLDQLIGEGHLGRYTMYSVTQRPKEDGTLDTQHRRYNFTDIQPGKSFRWDGSNTKDKAANWNTWYIVDFHRQGDLDAYGAAGEAFPGVHSEALCTNEPHGAYDGLQGVWEGEARSIDGAVSYAKLAAGKMLDGCSVAMVLETSLVQTFMTLGYVERFNHWVNFRLDSRVGTPHNYYVSETSGAGAVFTEAEALAIKDEFTPYLSSAAFNTDSAHKRTIWDGLGKNEIAFHEEYRDSADGEWYTTITYRLTRQ